LGNREPRLVPETAQRGKPLPPSALIARGVIGATLAAALAAFSAAALGGMKAVHKDPATSFALFSRLGDVLTPETVGAWAQLAGIALFGVVVGLAVAATAAARAGVKPRDESQRPVA
jgi:hypothetical protein